MAWSDLRPWGVKWRHIALALFALMLINGSVKSCGGGKREPEIRIAAGTLETEWSRVNGKDFNVAMRNGMFEETRPNDIEELAKDWLFYRKRILDRAASGDQAGAQDARNDFQRVNRWLEQYDQRDVSFIVGKHERR